MTRMALYVCETCRTVWKVVGEFSELGSLKNMVGDNPKCPRPHCSGYLIISVTLPPGVFRSMEIPIPTFFRSVLGFGSPDGNAAALQDFVDVLTSKRVFRVDAFNTGTPERVILKRLVMEDGTCLHFETSAKGACCFYIEKPGPSCLEVVDAELRRSSPPSSDRGTSPCGKEGRRTYSDEDSNVFPEFDFDSTTIELSESECLSSMSEEGRVQKGTPVE